MERIAIKMLIGDRAKYLGLVFGITFSTLLMSQQISLFIGIMARTGSQIEDVTEADVWVMDPQVLYVDEVKALPDRDLLRVRSVPGVEWAVPFFKGTAMMRAPGGIMRQVIIIGVDDSSLIGRPPKILMGKWEDLFEPTSMIMDRTGYEYVWPDDPLKERIVEMNDNRVVIAGICEASPSFLSFPLGYMRYSEAIKVAPGERNRMSFVLAKAQQGVSPKQLAESIHRSTGLQALTKEDFHWKSILYYLTHTGIPINFGLTVILGFIVGAAVTGQTFYIFIIENIRQFGALKAIGVTNSQILKMVLLQASLVAAIGYSLGIGLCTLFFTITGSLPALKGFYLRLPVALGVFMVVLVIVSLSSFFSIRRVFKIDPAIVFRE